MEPAERGCPEKGQPLLFDNTDIDAHLDQVVSLGNANNASTDNDHVMRFNAHKPSPSTSNQRLAYWLTGKRVPEVMI